MGCCGVYESVEKLCHSMARNRGHLSSQIETQLSPGEQRMKPLNNMAASGTWNFPFTSSATAPQNLVEMQILDLEPLRYRVLYGASFKNYLR